MPVEGDLITIDKRLLPLSWLYGIGVGIRNKLFDLGILKSRSFSVPVISVGNITVGGSGKTPHVEYLVELLKEDAKIAVLSRGYKRKTKGYLLADEHSTVADIGDEPYQMHQKYPDIVVAVDEDRCEGIDRLMTDEQTRDTEIILLDDAYQHRYVKPGINILLIDYHRLIVYDKLLPAGRLREPVSGKNRADIVIVTKCPDALNPIDYRVVSKALDLYPYQALLFSSIVYGDLRPFNGNAPARPLSSIVSDESVLLLSGIASPQQMENDLRAYSEHITPLIFADHHDFTAEDVDAIHQQFAALPSPKIIITTEKDEVRLRALDGLSDEVKAALYVLPIKIKFLLDHEETFNNKILSYVHKNSKNSILIRKKEEDKPKDTQQGTNRPRTISFRSD